jgi:hypothetical protein
MAKLGRYVPVERPDIDDGVYLAKILSAEVKTWPDGNSSVNWKFELSQPPFIGKKVWTWGSTGAVPTPRAKLTTWGFVLGQTLEQLKDENFDTKVLEGFYVKITIKTWEKESGGTKQAVTDINYLNEADVSMLQLWLGQAGVTGAIKVAVKANPSLTFTPAPVQAPAPVVAAPVPVVAQPVFVQAGLPVTTASQVQVAAPVVQVQPVQAPVVVAPVTAPGFAPGFAPVVAPMQPVPVTAAPAVKKSSGFPF